MISIFFFINSFTEKLVFALPSFRAPPQHGLKIGDIKVDMGSLGSSIEKIESSTHKVSVKYMDPHQSGMPTAGIVSVEEAGLRVNPNTTYIST